MGSKEIFIDEFTSEIDAVIDWGTIPGGTSVTPDEINCDNEPFAKGEGDGLVQGNTSGDGVFLGCQRFPYIPKSDLIQQIGWGSCLAASISMKLREYGIEVAEAHIREVSGVDLVRGGFIRDIPEALVKLGLKRKHAYKTNLTIDELDAATENGEFAIVSIKFLGGLHAIVVDGIDAGMVLIRDPAGSAYQVTIQDFVQQWGGVAVIPSP